MHTTMNSDIQYPRKHDVMLGRGGESNYHCGNISFRHMIQKYKESYRLGSRTKKLMLVNQVMEEWTNKSPPGRFVCKERNPGTGQSVWKAVSEEKARKRVTKSLAEWTPRDSNLDISSSNTSSDGGSTSATDHQSTGKQKRTASVVSKDDSTQGCQDLGNAKKRQKISLLDAPVDQPVSTTLQTATFQAAALNGLPSAPANPSQHGQQGQDEIMMWTLPFSSQPCNLPENSIDTLRPVFDMYQSSLVPTASELSSNLSFDEAMDVMDGLSYLANTSTVGSCCKAFDDSLPFELPSFDDDDDDLGSVASNNDDVALIFADFAAFEKRM